nr:hypothetical protein LOC_Os03g34160 [Oryza sativa Japonica Group]
MAVFPSDSDNWSDGGARLEQRRRQRREGVTPVAVGKLESKWEGPYLIKHRSPTGSFRLAILEGEEFDHSWNAASLRRFCM